jgi:hypothetical protein
MITDDMCKGSAVGFPEFCRKSEGGMTNLE